MAFEPLEDRSLLSGGPIGSLGVLGDSLSDEYPGGPYEYASSWVELLAEQKDINVGPWGDWGEPRREGYQYNWARWGATTGSMINEGMHTGLAEQALQGLVTHAVMAIGQNDFFFWDEAYRGIYSGSWSEAQVSSHLDGVLGNVRTALDALAATGVELVISNVADFGIAPLVRFLFPSADGREQVADVIEELNSRLGVLARDLDFPLVDLFGFSKEILGTNHAPKLFQMIGGNAIRNAGGFRPNAAFVFDGVHPNTVSQAVFANLFLEGFAVGYGTDVDPFTEAEIVGLVGLPYRGDTAGYAYSEYVVLPDAADFDLGPLAYAERDDLDPSMGEIWYRFETTLDGILTVEASIAAGQEAELALYDANLHQLACVSESDGLRIDVPADASATYYVRLTGSAGDVDLRLANLVQPSGGEVIVRSGAGPDTFEFRPTGSHRVVVNGIEYHFDEADVARFVFHADAEDEIRWHGSEQSDVLVARPRSATLTAPGFTLEAYGYETLATDAGGGDADVAFLFGSPLDDTLAASPEEAVFEGEGFKLAAAGFDYVHAYPGSGCDEAWLTGSAGDDIFIQTPQYGKLLNVQPEHRFFLRAKFFEIVHVDGRGGRDEGFLFDSPLDDSLEADKDRAVIRSNNLVYDFLYELAGFEAVRAHSTSGHDVATVAPDATYLELLGNWL